MKYHVRPTKFIWFCLIMKNTTKHAKRFRTFRRISRENDQERAIFCLTYFLSICQSWSFVLTRCCVLILATQIPIRATLKIYTDRTRTGSSVLSSGWLLVKQLLNRVRLKGTGSLRSTVACSTAGIHGHTWLVDTWLVDRKPHEKTFRRCPSTSLCAPSSEFCHIPGACTQLFSETCLFMRKRQ